MSNFVYVELELPVELPEDEPKKEVVFNYLVLEISPGNTNEIKI